MIDQHESSVRDGVGGPGSVTGPGGSDGDLAGARRPVSRRALLLAGSAALAAGGVAAVSNWLGSDEPAPRTTAEPTSPSRGTAPGGPALRALEDVLAEAEATAGHRLMGSPWNAWFGGTPEAWSGIYVAWLLRDNGARKTADVATLRAEYQRAGRVGEEPAPGALIFYSHGEVSQPHRVGFVTSVTRGVPQSVEGDHPFTRPYEERFVRRFSRPWDDRSRVSYAYPTYA